MRRAITFSFLALVASGCFRIPEIELPPEGPEATRARTESKCPEEPSRCYFAGNEYLPRRGAVTDYSKAAELFTHGCRAKDRASCEALTRLARNYEEGTDRLTNLITRDPGHAASLYREACDGGDPVACTALGRLYESGEGVGEDLAKAAGLHGKGCQGSWWSPSACARLATLHIEGRGVPVDVDAAARLFRRSCEGEWPAGCTGLGELHLLGRGVSKDPLEAARLFALGCEPKGSDRWPTACRHLGDLYRDGRGVTQDRELALKFYEMGCFSNDDGDRHSCENLASLRRAKGSSPGALSAETRACQLGSQSACDRLPSFMAPR